MKCIRSGQTSEREAERYWVIVKDCLSRVQENVHETSWRKVCLILIWLTSHAERTSCHMLSPRLVNRASCVHSEDWCDATWRPTEVYIDFSRPARRWKRWCLPDNGGHKLAQPVQKKNCKLVIQFSYRNFMTAGIDTLNHASFMQSKSGFQLVGSLTPEIKWLKNFQDLFQGFQETENTFWNGTKIIQHFLLELIEIRKPCLCLASTGWGMEPCWRWTLGTHYIELYSNR